MRMMMSVGSVVSVDSRRTLMHTSMHRKYWPVVQPRSMYPLTTRRTNTRHVTCIDTALWFLALRCWLLIPSCQCYSSTLTSTWTTMIRTSSTTFIKHLPIISGLSASHSFLTSFTTFVAHSFCRVLLVLLHATHLNSSVVSSLDHHHRCHIEVLSIASSFISSYMFLHVSSNIFYCFIQWLNWLDATIQLVLLFGMIDDDASLHHLSVVRWCMLLWCFKHSLDERWTWLMIWRMDELF